MRARPSTSAAIVRPPSSSTLTSMPAAAFFTAPLRHVSALADQPNTSNSYRPSRSGRNEPV